MAVAERIVSLLPSATEFVYALLHPEVFRDLPAEGRAMRICA